MKRVLITLLAALIGSAGLVLTACGGGGDNITEPQPQPRPPVDCKEKPEACK